MNLKPIYLQFEEKSLEKAVDKINEIFNDLFDNNRFISYISFRIDNHGSPVGLFITHAANTRQLIRYEFRIFEIPEVLSQQVIESEFLVAQNEGWYIKAARIMGNRCTLFLQRNEYER